jgi:tyrosine-protein kinase Etk/Wzc
MSSIHHSNDSTQDQEDEVHVLDLLKVLIDNIKLLIFLPLMAAMLAYVLVYFFVEPRYTGKVRFIAPQPPQSLGSGALSALGLQGLAGAGLGQTIRNPAEIYAAFMSSNRLKDVLIERYDLKNHYKGQSTEDIRDAVDNAAEVMLDKSGMVTVEFTHTNPKTAAAAANTYPEVLQSMLTEYAVNEATLRRTYFAKQIVVMREKVQKQESELKQIGLSTDMLKLDMNSAIGEISNLRASITAQEIRMRALSGYLSPTAPEYRLAQGELSSLRSQLQKAESQQNATDKSSSYPDEYRAYIYNLQLLENLIKQNELAEIDASKESVLVQIVDRAEVPEVKSGPSLRNAAIITGLLTGFLCLFFVYIRFGLRRAQVYHPEMGAKQAALAQSWRNAWRFGKRPV